MTSSPDIDFRKIARRGGSQDRAFEELCCQLAFTEAGPGSEFRRVRGDGGDGGVECFWTGRDGKVHAWQVKYMFDLGKTLDKAAASLAAARKNYPSLGHYSICLPFDLSGSKGRGGTSEQQRFQAFKQKQETASRAAGMDITVEPITAFYLQDRLLKLDAVGGRRRYWFDDRQLGADWFAAQLDSAVLRAGPRYRPELHHGHALEEALSALGDTEGWRARRDGWHRRAGKLTTRWSRTVSAKVAPMSDPFPPRATSSGADLAEALRRVTTMLAVGGDLAQGAIATRGARGVAGICERVLAEDLDTRFGAGSADSVTFRQREAELHAWLPAAHLDECREIVRFLSELASWLEGPPIRANVDRVLLVTGPAGIGKTHGLCDGAARRRDAGLLSVMVSGGQFSSDRSLWECLASALGLDGSWTRDTLLDALDSAAGADRLLLFVDALDERARRHRWLDELPELVQATRHRPNLALCLSVRDGYQQQVLRNDTVVPTLRHPGFGDMLFDACGAFFRHFKLEPPVGPLMEPEYANPLFLLVLCQTLVARGLHAVPTGWRGTRRVLAGLLTTRDEELQRQSPAVGNRAVTFAMEALAGALADGETIGRRAADDLVVGTLPKSQRAAVDLLDHIISLGLVRVVPGSGENWSDGEDQVDIAFGRLRHHLLADKLTTTRKVSDVQLRRAALADPGLAEALALVLPERWSGELLDLARNDKERRVLMAPWLDSLPWRDDETLDQVVKSFVFEALADPDLEHRALDALVTLSLRPGHALDHRFLHGFLSRHPMPKRDVGLTWYLYRSFERVSPPSPIVRALRAPWEGAVEGLDRPLREAWLVLLGWCGAAADRRVRDAATKAAVRISEADPGVWATVVEWFAGVDDDGVLERVLCAAYGAVLRNPAPQALSDLASAALRDVLRRSSGPPRHALVRGLALSIAEWAQHRGALPPEAPINAYQPPYEEVTEVVAPAEEDLERYDDDRDYPRLHASVMSEWSGDFAKYTMPFALGAYEELMTEEESRAWVLQEVIHMGYAPERHAAYDHHMLRVHGPGRGRPAWAERIGKKYQRIALARLVGALDDLSHARRSPPPFRTYLNLRDLDPSFLQREIPNDRGSASVDRWWAPVGMRFTGGASLTDEQWVAADDFPDPLAFVESLMDPGHPGRRWRLLDGHFSWADRRAGEEPDRYRDAWMMVKGYLVPRPRLAGCWRALGSADFMGKWMLEGFDVDERLHAGEYPWSPAFPEVREPAEVLYDQARRLERFDLRPAANRLMQAGDSWQEGSVGIAVPSAELVAATSTRWDGTSGFADEGGRLVFRDPSVAGGGPSGLYVDSEVLDDLLQRLHVGVIWTVLAERRIMGDSVGGTFCGMKHVSWTMRLVGDRVKVRRTSGEHLLPDHTRRPA